MSKQINTVTPPTLPPLCLSLLPLWLDADLLFLQIKITSCFVFLPVLHATVQESLSTLKTSSSADRDDVFANRFTVQSGNVTHWPTKYRVAEVCQGAHPPHIPLIHRQLGSNEVRTAVISLKTSLEVRQKGKNKEAFYNEGGIWCLQFSFGSVRTARNHGDSNICTINYCSG